MIVERQHHRYQVGDLAADAGDYRVYLCKQETTGRQCLLQIADQPAGNAALDRAAYFLRELESQAAEVEKEYEKVRTDPRSLLNYGLGFPELLDSFVSSEQGGRRINILAFRNIDDLKTVVPISKIIEVDRLRVDLRTSVWIMGKCLKLLAFAHSLGITVGKLDTGNILIEPDKHYVIIFDWSSASSHLIQEVLTTESVGDIALAARSVLSLLGGDLETGAVPDSEEGFRRYCNYLFSLSRGSQHDATEAHRRFYEIADSLWERKYYHFTAMPR